METISIELTPEDFVRCEKAARRRGISVAEWLAFLLAERVGHTSFAREG